MPLLLRSFCCAKVPALRTAHLAWQGFAGYSIPFEAGRCPLGPPTGTHVLSSRCTFFDSLTRAPESGALVFCLTDLRSCMRGAKILLDI